MVESGEVQAVIITKLDRGFRSASDCLNNVEAWERRTVSLHILNLGGTTIDTSTPTGKFFITVMAGAAELERNLIRERCNEGRKIRKAQGCRVGEIPFGFSLAADGKTLLKCGEEQEAITLALELRAQGYSASGIAAELNRRGIATKEGKSMDSQASDPAVPKGRLIPLSEHPKMGRLAEILGDLSSERQEAFGEWLESTSEDSQEDSES